MPDAKKPNPVRIPPVLIGAGVLIIALGFGLPGFISSPTPLPDAPPRAATEGAAAFAPRPESQAGTSKSPASVGLGLLQLVVALVVVCGLCVITTRWMGRKPSAPADQSMRVITSLRVGRCAVHLVRAGDRRMLIGTDVTGVKALVELSGPEPELPAATPTTETTSIAPAA
ncbi:flagellar biosynthetic protein FliO [Gemmata sp. G18]|uniref:Flagellar biosynthetic protein FliO n=1 Tax=Gemmata palustris TaxID=2822762 RepID=A0ABS5C4E5_9BACT|nr:flagellar biosynthetic protein FliO [Gemmata palustris]MBP3960881.1 flagellar biosynthetic protein FliO [Gemmata palustris]